MSQRSRRAAHLLRLEATLPPPAGTPAPSTPDASPDRQAQQRLLHQEAADLRAERRAIRQQRPPITAWIAILVITDNCSRRCIELPLLVAGVPPLFVVDNSVPHA